MKRVVLKRTIGFALAAVFLLQTMTVDAFAQPQQNAVHFEGNGKPILMIPENSDLFTNFKKLVPGDVKKQTITIKNTTGGRVEVYLRAENATQNPPKGKVPPLLDCLTIKVAYKRNSEQDIVLYEGLLSQSNKLSGEKNMKKDIYLGRYNKDTQGKLDITLTVPSELGTEYANAEARINWIFTFKDIEDVEDDEDNGGNHGDEWFVIPKDKDLGTLPKTGGQ